jgi:hypothetical protein
MELLAFLLPLIVFVNWSLNRIEKQTSRQKEIDNLNQQKKNKEMNNSSKKDLLIDKITAILKNRKLTYWVAQDEKSIKVSFSLNEGQVFDIFIYLSENFIEFSCPILLDVSDESVSSTAEIVTRLNQYYNFGNLRFYYESRAIVFQTIFILFENEITENKFMMYFDFTLEGARDCRPLVSKVVIDKEEPVIAMMGLGVNS